MRKIQPGEVWPISEMSAVGGGLVRVPGATPWTHVQFRRFVGCPICNLHLRQFARRKAELDQCGVAEVVVFASTRESLAKHASKSPFAMIADPTRELYRRAGLERSAWAMLHPKAWLAGMRGLVTAGAGFPGHVAEVNATPADFLIDAQGVVRASKYGRHADDQWSFDELMRLATSS